MWVMMSDELKSWNRNRRMKRSENGNSDYLERSDTNLRFCAPNFRKQLTATKVISEYWKLIVTLQHFAKYEAYVNIVKWT